MMNKGYKVNVALNPKNNFYYVYIYSTLDHEDAKRMRNEYRWKNLLGSMDIQHGIVLLLQSSRTTTEHQFNVVIFTAQ